MTNKEENFIKENSIIFKKYRIKKKLGEGAFGDVYIGSSIENNDLVAIKVEQRKIAKPLLETEAFFLYSLRGLGIPEVLSFGRLRNYNVLVEPLLDKSLFDLFAERRKRLALEDICLIAKQVIDRIQWVHSKNIVHRDIKPDNFLIGRKDPNVIYLIDFGLSKKYKSSTTGKHIKFGFTGKLTGTVRFASANALRGGEQSRRDDLESIGYMIIFFMRGRLPWQGVTGNKKMERYLKIYKMKKNVAPEDLCKSLPKQMTDFMRYVKQLEFEQEPDYNYLRNLFNSIIKRIHDTSDLLIFSWIRTADLPNLKNPINPATRRDSPQSRLYRKIETKLKNERNTSSDNDSGQKSIQTCTMIMNTMNSNMRIVDNNNLSKDEIEDIKLKTKKDKSKEGLNTMVANLNKTIDENIVDFGEDDKINKIASNDCSPINIKSNLDGNNTNYNKNKNKTVNESLNFISEKKNLQNFELSSSSKKENEMLKEKNEELNNVNVNVNINNNKENDNKEKNQNNKVEIKNEEKKGSEVISEYKDNRENPESNKENQNLLTKIISEDNTNINFSNNKNNINNINNINKDNLPKENDFYKNDENNIIDNNDKINDQNLIPQNNVSINDNPNTNIYNSQNINNNINIFNNNSNQKNSKLIKNKNSNEKLTDKNYMENQSQNKIQNQKKSITIVKKLNDINDIHFNNHIHNNNLMNNSNENKSKKDPNNIQIKDLLKSRNNNNINIIQKGKKTNTDTEEEPFDNMRNIKKMEKNNFIKLNNVQIGEKINMPMNTGNNSSKNVSDFKINKIKDMNNSLEVNFGLNNKMVSSSKKMKNRYQKKNTDYIENQNLNDGLDLLPKNSDFMMESGNKDVLNYTEKSQKIGKPNNLKNTNNSINLENYFSDNFNEHSKKKKMISNSVNIFNMNNNHMEDFMNSSNRMNNNMNNNMINPNNNITQNNNINSNMNMKENNNNNYMNNNNQSHINNNNNGNSTEFNNNRKIRIVNRNRNPNLNSINNNLVNDNNNLDYKNLNSLHKAKSKIKNENNNSMNNIIRKKFNNSINMNINNNINNNIIINNNINNNIYERGNNTVIMNNSKNINNQGINPATYILNKRPSHNINSNMIHSFNNLNQIEFTKRPSCDIKTNNYISINQMGVNKRPSYNTNFNVSNFLNNNGVQMMMSNTKIKKLNNNSINKVGGNINSNSVDKRLKMQQNQLYHLNVVQNNNTFTNIRPINNNLVNKYNMPSSNMNYQVYQSLQNKGQIGMMGQVGPMVTIGQIDQTKQMNPQTQIFNPNVRNNVIIGNVSTIPNFQNQINQMGNNPKQFNNNNAQIYGYRNF